MKENIVTTVDRYTGEIRESFVTVGFLKADLKKLSEMIDFDTKTSVLFALTRVMNKRSNEIAGTYAQLAKKTGCSEHATRNAVTAFLQADVLRRLGLSRYMMNPDMFCHVDGKSRHLLALEYQRLPRHTEKHN